MSIDKQNQHIGLIIESLLSSPTTRMTAKTVGVPIKLLHEAEGHVVTVELKTGEAYRGLLEESEDTMNCRMKEGEDIIYRRRSRK